MELQSILVLNNDCLLEVFKYLSIEDSINFAGSCTQMRVVADQAFKKKCSNFTIDRNMINLGITWLDRLLWYVGPHVLSLTVDWAWQTNQNQILKMIEENCVKLKCLILEHCEMGDFEPFNFTICIRMLTLNKCTLDRKKNIFQHFLYLNFLHIYHCNGIRPSVLRQCFENNPYIENLAFIGYGFDVRKTTGLLTQLEHLTKLKLNCQMQNLNNFLFELASRGIMEELELFRIKIDANTFNVLNSFKRLRLLALDQCSGFQELNLTLPLNLRHLQLKCFRVSFKAFILIIRQLKYLENIDLYCCNDFPPDSESISFDNITALSTEIMKNLDLTMNRTALVVTLPETYAQCDTSTQKFVYDSHYLKIFNNSYVKEYFHTFHLHKVFGNFAGLDYRFF